MIIDKLLKGDVRQYLRECPDRNLTSLRGSLAGVQEKLDDPSREISIEIDDLVRILRTGFNPVQRFVDRLDEIGSNVEDLRSGWSEELEMILELENSEENKRNWSNPEFFDDFEFYVKLCDFLNILESDDIEAHEDYEEIQNVIRHIQAALGEEIQKRGLRKKKIKHYRKVHSGKIREISDDEMGLSQRFVQIREKYQERQNKTTQKNRDTEEEYEEISDLIKESLKFNSPALCAQSLLLLGDLDNVYQYEEERDKVMEIFLKNINNADLQQLLNILAMLPYCYKDRPWHNMSNDIDARRRKCCLPDWEKKWDTIWERVFFIMNNYTEIFNGEAPEDINLGSLKSQIYFWGRENDRDAQEFLTKYKKRIEASERKDREKSINRIRNPENNTERQIAAQFGTFFAELYRQCGDWQITIEVNINGLDLDFRCQLPDDRVIFIEYDGGIHFSPDKRPTAATLRKMVRTDAQYPSIRVFRVPFFDVRSSIQRIRREVTKDSESPPNR